MIRTEKVIELLTLMISCVSHGDYYSIKELSYLELEKLNKQKNNQTKEINHIYRIKKLKKYKNVPLEKWRNKELIFLTKNYSKYIVKKIYSTNSIEELREDVISIEEFIEKI